MVGRQEHLEVFVILEVGLGSLGDLEAGLGSQDDLVVVLDNQDGLGVVHGIEDVQVAGLNYLDPWHLLVDPVYPLDLNSLIDFSRPMLPISKQLPTHHHQWCWPRYLDLSAEPSRNS